MAETVYILCAIAALACAALLARAYRKNPSHLILWSSVCFAALALNSILVVVDIILLPTTTDLRVIRLMVAAAGLVFLLFALIKESD